MAFNSGMNKNLKHGGVAVFASGGGTTFAAIADFLAGSSADSLSGAAPARAENHADPVRVLVADRPCAALEKAAARGIPARLCDKKAARGGEHFYHMDEIIQRMQPAVIALAGFLGILPRWFTSLYAGLIINTHPSLLPLHGGVGMYGDRVHEAVLRARETQSGCTVHFVTDEVDGGDIIAQRAVPVLESDTTDSLRARVQSAEQDLYPRVVRGLLEHRARGEDPASFRFSA